VNVWRQTEMGCDGSRPADCSRRAVLRRRRRGRPLLYVASPARWDRPMTRVQKGAKVWREGTERERKRNPPKSSWVEWTLQTVVYPVVGVYPFSEIWMPNNCHLEARISLSLNRSISIRDTQNICWSIQHYVPFHVGAECDSEPAVAQVL